MCSLALASNFNLYPDKDYDICTNYPSSCICDLMGPWNGVKVVSNVVYDLEASFIVHFPFYEEPNIYI